MDGSTVDGHHTFHLAESYATAGAPEIAVTLRDRVVAMGFYPADHYALVSPRLAPRRGRGDFAGVVKRARGRRRVRAGRRRGAWPVSRVGDRRRRAQPA